MPIVLSVLQKETVTPVSDMQSNRYWQVALFISLLIIMTLLSILIFILLKLPIHTAPMSDQNEIILQAKPVEKKYPAVKGEGSQRLAEQQLVINNAPLPVVNSVEINQPLAEQPRIINNTPLPAVKGATKNKPLPKLAEKIFFKTKPLPIPLPIPISKTFDKPLIALAPDKKVPQAEQDIDYSNVSNELQQRFERAVLMSKDAGKAFIESEDSDGTDIHQMAADFQDQVPDIHYDFHMYSSAAEERWIRINGEDLVEGQFDRSKELQVVEIQANRTIFRLGSQSFSLKSLTDWQHF